MGDLPLRVRRRAVSWVCVALVVLGAFAAAVSEPAEAQQVDCERVAYNERIVLKCTTTGDQSGPAPTTTVAPTAMPEPTSTPEPGATTTPEPEAEATPDSTVIPDSEVTPEPELTATAGPDSDADAGEDSDEDRVVEQPTESTNDRGDGQVDAVDSAVPSNRDDADTDRPANDDAGQEAAPLVEYDFDTTPDPVPNYLPAVVAIIGLAVVGALLLLTARQIRRATDVA